MELTAHYMSHPFQFLKAMWGFLELSWMRVFILILAWVGIGFVLYTNGGIYHIMNAIFFTIVETFFVSLATLIKFAGIGLLVWAYFSGKFGGSDSMSNSAYSDIPGNIYYTDDDDPYDPYN